MSCIVLWTVEGGGAGERLRREGCGDWWSVFVVVWEGMI